jgi:hypothetical protein
MISVYKLIDSRFPDVCLYVGKTNGSLQKRLLNHKCKRFRSILPYQGKEHVIIVLIETCREEDGHQREGFWINELRAIYNKQLSTWRVKTSAEPVSRTPRTADDFIFNRIKVI